MLKLPEVTLLEIDCFTPDKTLLSMVQSQKWVKFAEVILFTDTNKFPYLTKTGIPNFRVIHREHSTHKREVPGLKALPVDYELDVSRLPATVLETSHMLFMEWDSGVLNPDGWNERFLEYDYIGAPWPDHNDIGWPPCNETNNVGNGGFSLRSKKFCVATRTALDEADPNDQSILSSDRWACRTMRPAFERLGIKYAPEQVAARFSAENRIYSGQFGYHGTNTAALNGWGGRWLGSVRPASK